MHIFINETIIYLYSRGSCTLCTSWKNNLRQIHISSESIFYADTDYDEIVWCAEREKKSPLSSMRHCRLQTLVRSHQWHVCYIAILTFIFFIERYLFTLWPVDAPHIYVLAILNCTIRDMNKLFFRVYLANKWCPAQMYLFTLWPVDLELNARS